jgi:hypothetical protein
MFAGMAATYPSELPFRCSSIWQASCPYPQTLTMLERPAKDKHSSLLQAFVTYGRKKSFMEPTPGRDRRSVRGRWTSRSSG